MNERLLLSLGIKGSEARLYRAALKMRNATPAGLARAINIKRTTAYYTAKGLAEKGLLIEDATKRPRTFSSVSPEDIQELIDRERKRNSQREKNLKEFANELSRTIADETYPVPQIRFVEEEKLEDFLYKEIPKWHKSIMETDATYWGFQDHTFLENYVKVTDWYWKHTREPNFTVKLLSNQSSVENKMSGKYPRRTIKFWNKAGNFISTTWVMGNYVVMVNTHRHPFYLVEIHDATLAHDQREVFKNLWLLI